MAGSVVSNRIATLGILRGEGGRTIRPLFVTSALDLIADWAVLIALLALVYSLTNDLRVVALFLLARLIPHAVASMTRQVARVSLSWVSMAVLALFRAGVVALLIAVDQRTDLWWAWPVVLLSATAGMLVETHRCAMLVASLPRARLSAVDVACDVAARAAFVAGAVLSGVLLIWWSPRVVLLVGAIVLTASAIQMLLLALRQNSSMAPAFSVGDRSEQTTTPAVTAVDTVAITQRLREEPRLQLSAGSLFVTGLIAVSIQLALIVVVFESFDRPQAMLGFMFAAVAVGMVLGPLPIPRLLVRLPPSLLLTAVVGVLAASLVAVIHTPSPVMVLVVAFVSGLLAITSEKLAELSVRRLIPGRQLHAALRVMQRSVIAGQTGALVGVVLLAEVWVGGWTVFAITGACLGVIGLLFLHDEGGDQVSRSLRGRMRRA